MLDAAAAPKADRREPRLAPAGASARRSTSSAHSSPRPRSPRRQLTTGQSRADRSRSGQTDLTGGDLRPSARHPRPIPAPKSAPEHARRPPTFTRLALPRPTRRSFDHAAPSPRRRSARSTSPAATSRSGAAPRRPAPTTPPRAPGSPPVPDAAAPSIPEPRSSLPARTTRSSNGSNTRRAANRSASDPSVPTPGEPTGASRSVHAAGIIRWLPSGSTRISSSRPRRRIHPSSSSERPSHA